MIYVLVRYRRIKPYKQDANMATVLNKYHLFPFLLCSIALKFLNHGLGTWADIKFWPHNMYGDVIKITFDNHTIFSWTKKTSVLMIDRFLCFLRTDIIPCPTYLLSVYATISLKQPYYYQLYFVCRVINFIY